MCQPIAHVVNSFRLFPSEEGVNFQDVYLAFKNAAHLKNAA